MKQIFLILLLFSSISLGEYRVYQYSIKDNFDKTPAKIITSTLNPRAYIAYNSRGQLSLDLLRTWICPGATGNRKAICPSPYESLKDFNFE